MYYFITELYIQLFLLGAVINFLYCKLFKVKSGVLSCGLWGGQAFEGKELDIKKLGILGIFNIQRGEHSCGYYYNGNIQKGVNTMANFGKFIVDNKITPGEINSSIFLGHTRKATSGDHNEKNAHPHRIDNYVQTHNGFIRDIWNLTYKHDVNDEDYDVDSAGLAAIIKKDGWGVLNEYNGYAAIAATFEEEGALYLYHGASKEFIHGEVKEERPLFVLNEPEGVYYSSLEESLQFISSGKKPICVPHNVVYRFKNGVLEEVCTIERTENNIPVVAVSGKRKRNNVLFSNTENVHGHIPVSSGINHGGSPLALCEPIPNEVSPFVVFYRSGRHFRINKECHTVLLNGIYNITNDGKLAKKGELYTTQYFIRGVLISSHKEYKKVYKKYPNIETANKDNFAYIISEFSKYPVFLINNESTEVSLPMRKFWFYKKKRANVVFKPMFSSREYIICEGLLHEITGNNKEKICCEANSVFADSVYKIDKEDDTYEKQGLASLSNICFDLLNRELKKENLTKLPEPFLLYLDHVMSEIISMQEPSLSPTDNEIEEQVSRLLNDSFIENKSISSILIEEKFEDFATEKSILDYFLSFGESVEELSLYNNRYNYREFDEDIEKKTTPENKDEEIKTLYIKSQECLTEFSNVVDKLQAIDTSDLAQDIAFAGYSSIDTYKNNVNKVLTNDICNRLNVTKL